MSKPYVSVVIPVYNEQENLDTLFSRLTATMDKTGKPWKCCSRTTAATTVQERC